MSRTIKMTFLVSEEEKQTLQEWAEAKRIPLGPLMRSKLLELAEAGSVVKTPRGRPAQPEGKVGRPSGFAKLGPAGPNYAYRDIYNELQMGNNADRVLEGYKRVARDQAPTPQEWTAIKQEFRRRVEADEPLYYAKHPTAGQEWFEPSEPVYWDPTLGDLTV